MRQQDDILAGEQPGIERRLTAVDIEPGAGQPARLERIRHCRLVDDFATRDVDQISVRRQQREPAAIDQMMGFGRVRQWIDNMSISPSIASSDGQ